MTKDTSIGTLSLGRAFKMNPSSMSLTPAMKRNPTIAFGSSSPSAKDIKDVFSVHDGSFDQSTVFH